MARWDGKGDVKCGGGKPGRPVKLAGWSAGEGSGMRRVAVTCVEIRRNSGGEGGFLEGD